MLLLQDGTACSLHSIVPFRYLQLLSFEAPVLRNNIVGEVAFSQLPHNMPFDYLLKVISDFLDMIYCSSINVQH